MIEVLKGKSYDNAASFVAELNKARLANRKQWLVYRGQVAGRIIELKTFDHGDLQIIRVDGRDVRRREYDMNVGEWRREIEEAVSR